MDELWAAEESLGRQNEALSSGFRQVEAESRRYRDLFELAPTPYAVTSERGVVQAANHACARLLNIHQQFLTGKPLYVYVDKDDETHFFDLFRELREQGEVRDRRLRLRPRRSAPIAASVTAAARYFEKGRAAAGKVELYWMLQDLTPQQKAEDRLRENEEKYRSLFENAQEGICRSMPSGRFTAANPALARMMGYESADELLSVPASELFVDPSERDRLLEEVQAAPGSAVRDRELLLKKKDGSPLIASASIRAVRDAGGRVLAYESLLQDVTERRDLEDRLRRRDRLAAVGSTVAVLAHEISNPLTGMYTAIQLLERQLAGNEPKHRDLISTVRDLSAETCRLCDLVSDFRLLAQTEYSLEPVSLSELAIETMKIQSLNYGALGIRVELDFPAGLPAVMGDKNKLKQVLLNLYKNAVEAMPGGGTIFLRGTGQDDHVVLEVQDTGAGIPEGVDVFEPFVTTKEYGTGLGLPLVRQIVSAHGGTVACASEPGKGTTFRLALPSRPKK